MTVRAATFADLTVDMWIAWTDGRSAAAGQLLTIDQETGWLTMTAYTTTVTLNRDDPGEFTILRDPITTPVMVRREDFDNFVAALNEGEQVAEKGRALVNRADSSAVEA